MIKPTQEAEDIPEQFCGSRHKARAQQQNKPLELGARDIEKEEQEMKQGSREDMLFEKIRS